MSHRSRRGLAASPRLWLVAGVTLASCASSQTRRYQTLSSDLEHARAAAAQSADLTVANQPGGLRRDAFIRAVLARNPDVASARLAWRAALEEVPQATALPDPMVRYTLAPLSIASSDTRFGQIVGVEQRFPWPGKRGMAGDVALAEAEAARHDYETTRQALAEAASILFDQYIAATRSLELNAEHRALAADIQAAAQAQYEAGRASQQAPLQAELELAHVDHQRVALRSRQALLAARMNGLLHREPDAELPLPATEEVRVRDVESSAALQARALRQRPELRARDAVVRGRHSAVSLAHRELYPDLGVNAQYNSMWAETEHQWMVGVAVDVPLQRGSRHAAVRQARARLERAQLERESLANRIRVEVEAARLALLEAQHVVGLYRERLLPAARAQVEAARIGYETGKSGFQALIDAERSVRSLDMELQDAIAAVGQHRAELDRAVGDTPYLTEDEMESGDDR